MHKWNKHLVEVQEKIARTSPEIPAHRAAFKKGYSFSGIDCAKQLQIWDYVWRHASGWRDRFHAYLFLEHYITKVGADKALWQTTVAWQEQVDDWGLCDALAKIYTKLLEAFPKEVYAQLAEWNTSDNLWKRRQSVVSLLYYSRTKKTFLPFKKIAALVTPLLTDKEYYVQKGAGWTLREMRNVYADETMAYLEEHIKSISAIAFTISIEKMAGTQKNELKAMRRKTM